ncbi:hypothetical protein BACT_0519 [Bifidobacterium actinocoloniiforme DSM 22766]|uniref:Helix-turn-helix domain-containing protein n=1 Tax=Bifidobacterium actinocoloniiforme DSM 22766 TaxID=1437605 RepID=A0A086YZW8_9BIFI|nr:hypothetical protein [Bifidobacterium actinocoloniiforme]KFI39818.1 hypothetical protein BACT_0519 [Bifidobacterium actinocoloniiforme DSM 22766]
MSDHSIPTQATERSETSDNVLPGNGDTVVVQIGLADLVAAFREVAVELSKDTYQIAVPVRTATRMLGMQDDGFTRDLIKAGRLRARKERGKRTKLVSVQSIRQYMGDVPKGGQR